MGAASWLVWRDGGVAEHPLPLALYVAQLLLNWAWSPLFFTAHRLGAALLEVQAQHVPDAACVVCVCAFVYVCVCVRVCVCVCLHARVRERKRAGEKKGEKEKK